MAIITDIIDVVSSTIKDILPILCLLVVFQYMVLKQNLPNLRKVILGMILVIPGLAFFLFGLEMALFPVGDMMAQQLSSYEFISKYYHDPESWMAYYWIYIFAFTIGFATTIAEPSLIAVTYKAHEISGGKIGEFSLRLTVALGVAISLAVGCYRIVSGTPLYLYILIGYVISIIQTIFAPKDIIALAYDSGGVTTSTVTVPIVAALGLGLASVVPGRNPAVDGFGLIAFASLFPIITVLAYGQIIDFISKLNKRRYEI